MSPPRSARRPAGAALVLLGLALLLSACERKPPPEPTAVGFTLTRVDYAALPDWAEDETVEALPALKRSCGKLTRGAEDRAIGPQGLGGTVADWRAACGALLAAPADSAGLRAAFENALVPFRVEPEDGGAGLFTGYYEPELNGSRKASEAYRWPLYRPPDDLISVNLGDFAADLKGRRIVGRVANGRLRPYNPRAEIDSGLLEGRGLELVWLDDPVDRFFLHVQGSGRVRLAEGGTLRVGYAASNGLPFYAIGRALIDEGAVSRDKASMQEIRDWLRAHPEKGQAIMARNARYIFFREIEGEGPVGALGVPLTAGRSLAIDADLLPLGLPLWLDTTWPGRDKPLRRLVLAQDVGSAIKGAVRGDLFWGTGDRALEFAGRMKQAGRYYLFLPRSVADRRAASS